MKKKRKPIVTYLMSSLFMYGYTFIFSIAAMIFLLDKIPHWLQAVMGIVFLAPVVAMYFLMGKREGEELYKNCAAGTLTKVHDKAPLTIPRYKALYHVIGFAAPTILLALIAGFTGSAGTAGVVAFLFMPVTLFFLGCGIVTLPIDKLYTAIYIFVPAVIILSLIFVAGFLFSIYKQKRQQGEIESELRSFDN